MSTLQQKLDRIREAFTRQIPEAARATMRRAEEELRASELMRRLPRPGDPLPAFALPDTDQHLVRSGDLLGRGPLVLSFYRGVW
jgi:hypothetical protein